MIVRDSSNTKVTAKAGQKLFSFSVSRQANRKRARVRRCLVSVNGFVTVSRGLVTLLSFARVSLVLCVSLSLCVSVSRSRGKCPASDGLKRTERGESHGSERERAPALLRELFRGIPVSPFFEPFPIRICLSSFVRFSVRLECAGRVEVSTTAKHRSKLRIYLKTLRGSLR